MDLINDLSIMISLFLKESTPVQYVKVVAIKCERLGFKQDKVYRVYQKGKKFLDGCFTFGFLLKGEDGMYMWVSHQHIIFVDNKDLGRTKMIVNCISLKVKEGCIEPFILISKKNQKATLMEPENLRFDIVQSLEDPTEFIFYEVFSSAEGAAAHKETEHIKAWKAEAPNYLIDKKSAKYKVIGPEDPNMWKSNK